MVGGKFTFCKTCAAERKREAHAKWRKTPEGRAKVIECQQRYFKTEKGLAQREKANAKKRKTPNTKCQTKRCKHPPRTPRALFCEACREAHKVQAQLSWRAKPECKEYADAWRAAHRDRVNEEARLIREHYRLTVPRKPAGRKKKS